MAISAWLDTPARRTAAEAAVVITASLAAATLASAVLEGVVGVVDASPVYLLAVVVAASRYGTWPAIATSGLAFLVYDFLFTIPRLTFAVDDPGEWLSLLLFLSIAVVIGRLAALLRERIEVADRRSRESVSLAAIGREIAMATSFDAAAPAVAERLRDDAEMETVGIELEAPPGTGPVSAVLVGSPEAATDDGTPPWTMLRSPDGTSDWLRVVERGSAASPPASPAATGPRTHDAYLVPIEADGVPLGSIRATRPIGAPMPGRGARRILLHAADQLGIAIRRDQLREEITAGEVGRRGDALRAAILDSVSHDLRTPLATIRALAGGLLDPDRVPGDDAVRAVGGSIDGEAERLGELVASLLDMSRIQAGAVQPDLEPYEVVELVETAVRRVAQRAAGSRIRVEVPHDLAPVAADAILFDVAFGNVLDNALRYAPAPAEVVVTAAAADDDRMVAVLVDDAGAGVPPDALPLLFERFYRVPGEQDPARRGIGMGLAIARGFIEAMGGTIAVSASDLGGLRVSIRLPIAASRPAPVG
jgi:two-component system sensor histidine kinase KdpD